MESTEVLPPHAVGLTIAGGGGGVFATCSSCNDAVGGGAGEGRVRYGLGARQEIGASGFGGYFGSNNASGWVAGGSVSYKVAPLEWLAIVARGGAMDQASTTWP